MEHKVFDDAQYRFETHGPGYLMRGPLTDIGIVKLRPGDDAENHYHKDLEETFFVLEGEATLWIECKDEYLLKPGDVYKAEPGEMHYFVNNSDKDFRAIFIKAPYDPEDGVKVPWVPGEPVPNNSK